MKLTFQAIRLTLVFTVITGCLYPFVMTVVAHVAFPAQAEGSLVLRDGKLVGSALIAQQFQGTKYFWPRPSAGTYATASAASSSVSVRWCGVASVVIRTPRAFAAATASIDWMLERCWTWMRPPSYSAISASRAIIVLSEVGGIPARPSRAETVPSCITPPRVSCGSS